MRLPQPVMPRLALVLLMFALAGCGEDPAGPGPGDELASIRVTANVSNTAIDILVVTVTAPDFPVAPVFNLPVNNGVSSGTVRVPPGSARLFTVTAFDATGEITHEGSATRDVQRGQNPPLAIPLTPRSGQVPLTISFGDFSVVVAPASQELDLATQGSFQLTVTVTNADGNPVQDPEVAWATTNPSRAQVNAQGLVTLLLAGEVDIVATYNGIAGISHLTLAGAIPTTFYEDLDGDGYGNPANSLMIGAGELSPVGYVPNSGDCDDNNAATNPDGFEFLDFTDNDCDGLIDEFVSVSVYQDQDGDGFGASELLVQTDETGSYVIPAGYVLLPGDCDDGNAGTYPTAPEVTNDGVDNNCNTIIDEELILAWLDDDLDGYGNPIAVSETLAPLPM